MKYVSYVTYTRDKEKILAHRPKHREYLSGLLREGKLVGSGPFADDSGALFIYEAETAEAALALIAADPFCVAGVFERRELKPWRVVFANPGLLRADS
jgi:uncharacterized protein